MNYSIDELHPGSDADAASDPAQADAVARQIVRAIPRAMRQIRLVARSRSAALTVPQFRALGYLRRHPGANLGAVADHLGVSLPATSALVNRLVAMGFVEQSTDPVDRRRIRLGLTDTGLERVAISDAAVTAWWRERLEHVSHAERLALGRALALLDRLSSEIPGPRNGEPRA